MSGPTENTTSDAFEKPSKREAILSLFAARRMLPLVKRIVNDILESWSTLGRLQPEQAELDRQKRTLDWPQRARRYQLREEIAQAESGLKQAITELRILGVVLVDARTGRVGFPTIVNSRKAYFSWRPGEESLRSWHFAEETVYRPIPASWARADESTLSGKV
jgi:hypothetical protein